MIYPKVLTEDATLLAANGGMSLARFGDGELKLLLGHSAKSQRYEPDLSGHLAKVLAFPGENCLPCIPRMDFGSPKAAFWEAYKAHRFTQYYPHRATFGSAFVTRPDSAPHIDRADYWEQLFALWKDRDVVLVRGSEKSFTPERLVGAKSVKEIIGPRQHAWTVRDEIFREVYRETRPVILCLGATATVLAWRLAQEGVHALDLGHAGMFTKRRGEDGTTGRDYVKGDADV